MVNVSGGMKALSTLKRRVSACSQKSNLNPGFRTVFNGRDTLSNSLSAKDKFQYRNRILRPCMKGPHSVQFLRLQIEENQSVISKEMKIMLGVLRQFCRQYPRAQVEFLAGCHHPHFDPSKPASNRSRFFKP